MLQQTQVQTVVPYFSRWMERFPTLADLAEADEQEVLKTWEGLGYYSRARNLLKAARWVCEQNSGHMPSDMASLTHLPGIGNYTAAAIASIAYNADVIALDANIRRVIARLVDLPVPVRSREGEQAIAAFAQRVLPKGEAGDFNQALMDLGAMVCTPHNPECSLCPLTMHCLAFQNGTQLIRPILPSKKVVPRITVAAAIIIREGRMLLARRPSKGLLGGMWEFPGGKVEGDESLEQALQREIHEELDTHITVGALLGVYHHAYTHFKVQLHAFYCRLDGAEPKPLEASALQWVSAEQLSTFPMGKLDRMISRDVLEKAKAEASILAHSGKIKDRH